MNEITEQIDTQQQIVAGASARWEWPDFMVNAILELRPQTIGDLYQLVETRMERWPRSSMEWSMQSTRSEFMRRGRNRTDRRDDTRQPKQPFHADSKKPNPTTTTRFQRPNTRNNDDRQQRIPNRANKRQTNIAPSERECPWCLKKGCPPLNCPEATKGNPRTPYPRNHPRYRSPRAPRQARAPKGAFTNDVHNPIGGGFRLKCDTL